MADVLGPLSAHPGASTNSNFNLDCAMGSTTLLAAALAAVPLVRPPLDPPASVIPGGKSAWVQIHDLSGRVVVSRLAVDGDRGAVVWNGRDDQGDPVPAGLYWATRGGGEPLVTAGDPWSRCSPDPALDLGNSGCFDAQEVAAPTAVRDGDTLKVWYSGFDGTPDGPLRIGFAWSIDLGASWNRTCTPALREGSGGSFDALGVTAPHVHFDPNGSLVLYYAGFDGAVYRIGRATTADGGRSWSRNPAIPVFSGQTAWSDFAAYKAVRYEAGSYIMWFVGLRADGRIDGPIGAQPWKIGRAISDDGIFWTTSPSGPVYEGGAEWESFGTTTVDVLRDGDEWVMWYGGTDGDTLRIGAARSADGIEWSPNGGNPILGVGGRGLWGRA